MQIRTLRVLLITLGMFFLLALLTLRHRFSEPRTSVPNYGPVAPFQLTDQFGKPFGSGDLQGHLWLADFIFTRCQGPCPLLSSRMASIAGQLKPDPDLRFVSFSVDPLADTPEVLERYAQRYAVNEPRWYFLTGDVLSMYTLIEKGFLLPVGTMPPLDRVIGGDLITHTMRFVVIDQQGQVRGYFDGDDPSSHDRILQTVQQLIEESSP